MAENSKNSIYLQLALDLERRIHHNLLPAGTALPSLKATCKLHHISYMTAYRIYDFLARRGVIYSINGKGYFVSEHRPAPQSPITLPPLEEIVVFPNPEAPRGKDHQLDGIKKRTQELDIPLKILSECDELKLGNTSGIILSYAGSFMRLYQKLECRRLRVVLMNNYFPELHCVIHDSFHAMYNIFDRMEAYGCKKPVLCGRHFTDLGQANLNEREFAFELECQRRNLSGRILKSGNFAELKELCASETNCPDGMIFASKSSAETFFNLEKTGVFPPGLYTVTIGAVQPPPDKADVWLFSGARLGYEAVNVLMENSPEDWTLPAVKRIPGEWLR